MNWNHNDQCVNKRHDPVTHWACRMRLPICINQWGGNSQGVRGGGGGEDEEVFQVFLVFWAPCFSSNQQTLNNQEYQPSRPRETNPAHLVRPHIFSIESLSRKGYKTRMIYLAHRSAAGRVQGRTMG